MELNGVFFTLCAILRFVVALSTLKEMGHPQPPKPIHCNNSTAVGITKKHRETPKILINGNEIFLVMEAVEIGEFDVKYYPGKENLGNYQSKHHIGAQHTAVRPWYLHELTSVPELSRAGKPSTLKGYVETLIDGYVYTGPLPQLTTKQSVPTSGKCLPTYFGIPLLHTLCRAIGPAKARAQTLW
jgi:hypothetical protein